MQNKIIAKLAAIQRDLKAPKNQFNKFGNYKYRSCEDILESLKGLLEKTRTSLKLSDELILLGDRFYLKTTATLYDLESDEKIENIAYAREEETKKGMDGSQITGTASSYARKYALNGLFLIDDTKDADTNEYHNQINKTNIKEEKEIKATDNQIAIIVANSENEIVQKALNFYKKEINDLNIKEASSIIKRLKENNNE